MYNSYTNRKLLEIVQKSSSPISISTALSPGVKIERALSILKGRLGEAFEGGLESAIYVQSADCGVGKSATAQAAIADWKARGFPGGGGIIIAVNTLAEIDAYIGGTKLDSLDYCAVTADHHYNEYGLGRSKAAEAKVVFTTHEQFRCRLAEAASFVAGDCFHHNGKPRCAVVWDEGLAVAQAASFDLNEMIALPAALRASSRANQRVFEQLVPDKADRIPGRQMLLSVEVGKLARKIAIEKKGGLAEPSLQALDAIGKLRGSKAFFRGSEAEGWGLIGRGVPLPSDMPPLFVLDASARLTRQYDCLHRYGFKVVELEPAAVSYSSLDIHWWDRGSGQTVLSSLSERAKIIRTIAGLINGKSAERWLVVHSKAFGKKDRDGGHMLPDELTAKLDRPDLVSSLTWGRHLGTNEYRDVANVIVLGSYSYNPAAYEALHLAVSGQPDGIVAPEERRAREEAEFIHNLYQALCRSRIRYQVNGVCSPTTAYLIMPHAGRREELVKQAFKDCSITMWQPVEKKASSKFDLIAAAIQNLPKGRSVVTKAEIINSLGSSDPSYLDKVIRGAKFQRFAASNGITVKAGVIYLSKAMSVAA